MKTYPRADWIEIDKFSKKKMDKYEEIIFTYLKNEEISKSWESYKWNYPADVLAYNIAFLLLDA